MPHSSLRASLKPEFQKPTSQSSQSNSNQYGFDILAKENLTHVTSYLDPASLFAVSGVNKFLHEHVKDDHTWRRAFLLNFLGVKPEADLDPSTGLLLRRSESSWAREYVARSNIRRRWESLRNSTIAYAPVHSSVSDVHLLNNAVPSLLASSLQYGIVSRSVLLTGKVLRGFLSPSAAGTGLGIGNPNTEFAPDVSACAMSSDGGTAKIAWGMRNGEVAVSIAAKTMDTNTRSAAKLGRCTVQDQHEGEVVDVVWDDGGGLVASGAKDGRIKIWDAKTVRCFWTSEYLIPEYPTTIRLVTGKSGTAVVAGTSSGDVIVWTGLAVTAVDRETIGGTKNKVSCPVQANAQTPEDSHTILTDPIIRALHVDVVTDTNFICVIVAYDSQPEFYRIAIPFEDLGAQPNITTFKDQSSFIGTVSSVFPCLCPSREGETSFIITGTSLGWVCVYPYPPPSQSTAVKPLRKFEAHTDGQSVTALAWNSVTLVTGSVNGSTSAFDSYTFERLRTFGSPMPRSRPRGGGGNVAERVEGVKKILLGPEKDVLAISVGDRVMGYKADLVPKTNKMKSKQAGKKKAKGTSMAKGHDHHILNQLISDSMQEQNAESEYMRVIHGRERRQRLNLERLGLNEVEAVEYVLMLSRDEALAREAQEAQQQQHLVEEGVFEGDFNFGDGMIPSTRELPTSTATSPPSSRSSSQGSPKPSSPGLSSSLPQSPPRSSRPIYSAYTPPRPFSNEKVQVSPRFRQEAREAGWGGGGGDQESRSVGGVSQSWSSVASSVSDIDLAGVAGRNVDEGSDPFPSISPKLSKKSFSEGPSRKGAWAAGSPSPSYTSAEASTSTSSKQNNAPHKPATFSVCGVSDDEDEDLKLALQLSLEEARIRGEVV
ncbi:hypothetical protein E1B28_013339 [Marasmius oreades]|uniref:F-box domain-containing protein n=1 Tax=Marasmius oreades TaxID=181124 RepID=A0A9P7RQD2_9AGAR|nr:uncharacterized protein E1B28_013339 [Marasmius oreades]KAG7087366.1 hypothetical protein E1B28_013339 [Marasmius oreades]